MREIDDIIIHCTATPAGRPHTVEDVRQWHRQRGWQDIGYHYLVYLDGSIHRGRPEEQEGAHCYGHNAHSIGVAYVGGLSQDGKDALDKHLTLVKRLRKSARDEANKRYTLMDDYLANYSHMSYNDYIKMRNNGNNTR